MLSAGRPPVRDESLLPSRRLLPGPYSATGCAVHGRRGSRRCSECLRSAAGRVSAPTTTVLRRCSATTGRFSACVGLRSRTRAIFGGFGGRSSSNTLSTKFNSCAAELCPSAAAVATAILRPYDAATASATTSSTTPVSFPASAATSLRGAPNVGSSSADAESEWICASSRLRATRFRATRFCASRGDATSRRKWVRTRRCQWSPTSAAE